MGICESKPALRQASNSPPPKRENEAFLEMKHSVESLQDVTKVPEKNDDVSAILRTGSYHEAITNAPQFNPDGSLVIPYVAYEYPDAAELAKLRTIFICGRPGSGKTTQAKNLNERFGFSVISLQGLVQKELKLKSKEGLRASKQMHSEGSISPELAVYLLTRTIMETNNNKKNMGFILEDVPENKRFAECMEGVGLEPSVIFEINCSPLNCVQRVAAQNKGLLTPDFTQRQNNYLPSNQLFSQKYHKVIHRINGDNTEEHTFTRMAAIIEDLIIPEAKDLDANVDTHVLHIDVELAPGKYLGVSMYCAPGETAVRITDIEDDGALARYVHLINNGDVLISVNGKDVGDDFDAAEYALLSLLSDTPSNVKLTILRGDKYKPPSRCASPHKKISQFTTPQKSSQSLVLGKSITMARLDEQTVELSTPTINETLNESHVDMGMGVNKVDEIPCVRLQHIIVDCVEYLDQPHRIKEEGLFRTSGSQDKVMEVHGLLSENGIFDLETIDDPAVVTSLMKKIMRAKQFPLTQELAKSLLEAKTGEEMMAALHMLSPQRRVALVSIKSLLINVANNEENKMKLHALAIAFGPTLFPGLGQTDALQLLNLLKSAFESSSKIVELPIDANGIVTEETESQA